MTKETDFLIIGAGPFGLSLAAYAQHLGIDYTILGKPMGFWKNNMPDGMYLRSASDWHLDPINEYTLENYIEQLGKTPADVEPLSIHFYLDYCEWFRQQKDIQPLDLHVCKLDREGDVFLAQSEDGTTIRSKNVVLALGFKYFANIPKPLESMFPDGRWGHTCYEVDLKKLQNKRCLIIGGRQSAFEWAALLPEAGTRAVHVVHRHDTPAFAEADWSWVPPMVDTFKIDPDWYRSLSESEKKEIESRLWTEGRLKVEPWLDARVHREHTQLWPNSECTACTEQEDGSLEVKLSSGDSLTVDHIILATGYRVDLSRIPFLQDSPLLSRITTKNNYPVLDKYMQTTVPGLYMTSMAATQDFGPFFAFTVSVRSSAHMIGAAMQGTASPA